MTLLPRDGSRASSAQRGRSIIPKSGTRPRRPQPPATQEVEPWGPRELAVTEEVEPQPASKRVVAPPYMPGSQLPVEARLSARVRAWVRRPVALREAVVVKEILDRPVALRRRQIR